MAEGFWVGFAFGVGVTVAAFFLVAWDRYKRIPDSPMAFKKRAVLRVVKGGRR